MQRELKIVLSVDKRTGALRVVEGEFEALTKKAKSVDGQIRQISARLATLAKAAVGIYTLKQAFGATVGVGMKFLTQMETMKIGIASLIAVNAKAAAGMDKWKLSMEAATDVLGALKQANKETSATLPELVQGFQAAAGPALRAGLTLKQTVEYTKLMTQAAGAMGVPMNQLAQELKSVVSGTIDLNSVVASNLGITNQQIKLHKEQGDLFEFLKGKLSAFALAGESVSESMDGLLSNLNDSWSSVAAGIVESSGAFEVVKTALAQANEEISKIADNKEQMDALGEAGRFAFSVIAKGAAFVVQAFGGILEALHTAKAGFEELWNAGRIVFNKLKIKFLEVQSTFFEATNIFGNHNEKLQQIQKTIHRLKIENSSYRSSITNIDKENRKFISGLDGIIKKSWKIADAFDKSIKKSATSAIEATAKSADRSANSIKTSYKNALTFVSHKHDKMAHSISRGADRIAEKERKVAQEISKAYAQATKSKLEQLNLWVEQKAKEIEDSIKDEELKNETLYKLSLTYSAKLQKIEEEQAKKAKDLEDEIFSKVKMNADAEYEYKVGKLNEWVKQKAEEIKNSITDEETRNRELTILGEAYYSELSRLEEDLTKKRGEEAEARKKAELDANRDTVKGLALGFQKVVDDWRDKTGDMVKIGSKFAESITTSLQDEFVDVFNGKVKGIGTFFSDVFGDIKKTFIRIIGQMAAEKIVMGFKNVWSGNPDEGQGFVEKLLGIDIPFLKFAKGTIWGDGRYGIVDGVAPYPGDNFKNDTVPALISAGEAVLPRSVVQRHKPLVQALISNAVDGLPYARGILGGDFDVAELLGGTVFKGAQKRAFGGWLGKKLSQAWKKTKKFLGKGWNWLKDKGGDLWDWVKGLGKKALKVIKKIGSAIFKAVGKAIMALVKNPALGWLGQIAIGLINPAAIPAMLTADLASAGISVATGGSVGDALKAAGLSGLVAGAGATFSDLLQYGEVNPTNIGVIDAIHTYPEVLKNSILDKWDTLKEGISKLTGQDIASLNPQSFSSNMWESVKGSFLNIGDRLKEIGSQGWEYLKSYIEDPSKIVQYIIDHIKDIVSHVATTIAGIMQNPFVSSLAAKSLIDKEHPLGLKDGIAKFGDGGLVHKRMIAEVAERGEPELITPLSRVGDVFESRSIVERLEQIELLLAEMLLLQKKQYRLALEQK